MPLGILGSLVICTVLYILVSGLLTHLVPYTQLNVPDPVVVGIRTTGQQWATFLVELGALAGLATVMLVMLLGRSEEHTSELQSLTNLVCRLLLEKKNKITTQRCC